MKPSRVRPGDELEVICGRWVTVENVTVRWGRTVAVCTNSWHITLDADGGFPLSQWRPLVGSAFDRQLDAMAARGDT